MTLSFTLTQSLDRISKTHLETQGQQGKRQNKLVYHLFSTEAPTTIFPNDATFAQLKNSTPLKPTKQVTSTKELN